MADVRNDIERYLRGEMSPTEMHALEKRALNDPFLADALEGGANFPNEFAGDVTALNHQIASKATRKRQQPTQRYRWYYQAAAAVLLMGVSAILIYYLSGRQQTVTPITMNSQEEKPVQENYAPPTDTMNVPRNKQQPTEAEAPRETKTEKIETSPAAPPKPVPQQATADAATPDTEVTPPLTLPDSMEVRSFALRRETKKEITGNAKGAPSLPLEFQAAEVTEGQIIRGTVTDIDDGLPLPGVNVIAKGTTTGTVTDLNGNYEIQVSPATGSLVFSFIGLQSREIDVSPAADEITEVDVQMEPDVSSLSEVVVVGYGTERDFEFEGTKWEPAEPAGGKRAFKTYLESNMRYPEVALENKVEGKVTVQFTIEPSGTLTDFRVVRGLGYGCDEEVIRLIKNGPQWKPTKRNDEPVRGKGKVKLRFALPSNKK